MSSNFNGPHYNGNYKRNRAYIATFDLMGAPYGSFCDNTSNKELNATECALWMCVQTYHTTVHSGNQNQTVISHMDQIAVHDTTGYNTFSPVPAIDDKHSVTNFTFYGLAQAALGTWIDSIIGGNVTLKLEAQKPSSALTLGIWKGTENLDIWIANVAKSVTNVIRTTATKHHPQYNGRAWGMGVHIRWMWLLFPLVSIALSLVVLVAAIVRTARSPVEAWKGSPITLLLFGVDQQIKAAAYGKGVSRDGFREAVGEKEVRLTEESGTLWKFKSG